MANLRFKASAAMPAQQTCFSGNTASQAAGAWDLLQRIDIHSGAGVLIPSMDIPHRGAANCRGETSILRLASCRFFLVDSCPPNALPVSSRLEFVLRFFTSKEYKLL